MADVSITAISGSGTLVTYTAANTFTAGQRIEVFGATVSGFNSPNTSSGYGFIVNTATSSQFTVSNTTTGASSTAIARLLADVADVNDITEASATYGRPQYDLSHDAVSTNFALKDAAYDVTIGSQPFILRVNAQSQYERQTAPYKKDQFDSSNEPGEQSLTGWWLRSQTSWHNGAGINYFEPGTEKNVAHRFHDSRGVDVWTIGDAKLLKDTFQLYSNTGVGKIVATAANDGSYDCLVSGDNAGALKKVRFNTVTPDADVTSDGTYTTSYTLHADHTSAHDFLSVTTDGAHYYAACERGVHRGKVGGTTSDGMISEYAASTIGQTVIKYAKGYLLLGQKNTIYELNPALTAITGTTHNKTSTPTDSTASKSHPNSDWIWKSITGGPNAIYAAGTAGGVSEIWKIPYNTAKTNIDLAAMTVAAVLPFNERIVSIRSYLSYILIGTSKGARVGTLDSNGDLVYGPLLWGESRDVNDFHFAGNFAYAATILTNGPQHAGLIRIDLGNPFDDGTFPYAADLEYSSPSSSEATGVFMLDDRLIIVSEEATGGKLNAESYSNYRTSGWIQTGRIRYATVEPKFFKYINVNVDINEGDSIQISTIDHKDNEFLTTVIGSTEENISLPYPSGSQEFIALKFTLTNANPFTDTPILQSYQLKSLPATKRQRLINYPLSCFDIEMDKFNSQFGYTGRAGEALLELESLESTGDFVTVTDYRINETFSGIIEQVRFVNESSPDKTNSGYGGTVFVTVRKLS
jgi:hypothetical protein